MATSTWSWNGGTGQSTITTDWTLLSGPGDIAGYPGPGDTMIDAGGMILTPVDTMLSGNTIEIAGTAGAARLAFSGDGALGPAAPTIDRNSLIESRIGIQTAAGAAVLDTFGTFINQGTIAANGPAGSTFTIDVQQGTAGNPGVAINDGEIAVTTGNTMTIAVGANAALYNPGLIEVVGGSLDITSVGTAAFDGGYAPVRGELLIGGGGQAELATGFSTATRGWVPVFAFADGNHDTLKLDQAAAVGARVYGFAAGDTIDVGTLAVTGYSYNSVNGILALQNGAATVASLLLASGSFTASDIQIGTVAGDTVITTSYTNEVWNGTAGGSFGNGALWSGGTVPVGSDTAVIESNGGGALVTTGTSAFAVASLILTGSDTLQVGGSLAVANGAASNAGGTIEVTSGGTLSAEIYLQTGAAVDLLLDPGAVATLAGRENFAFPNATDTMPPDANDPAEKIALIVTGAASVNGATLAAGGFTSIGTGGGAPAVMSVSGGATVTDTYALLSSDATSFGTLSLSGVGTSWTDRIDPNDTLNTRGYMVVGFSAVGGPAPAAGAAVLSVSNGAVLTEASFANIGDTANSTGSVTVTSGGVWNIGSVTGGYLDVGLYGTGALTIGVGGTVTVGNVGTFISNGATFTGGGIGIGHHTGSSGSLSVVGGLLVDAGGMGVGQGGQGSLSVSDGGTVEVNGQGIGIGQTAGIAGTISVSGPGALLTVGAATTGFGVNQGILEVLAGGTVLLNSVGHGIGIAGSAGDSGTVLVSGTGALLALSAAAGGLAVGNGGQGLVEVLAGGTIAVTASGQGVSVGSTGTLAGNGLVESSVANSGTIESLAGTPGTFPTLEITGSVTGSGTIDLVPNSVLRLDQAPASTEVVNFDTGGAAVLILANTPGVIANPITGLNVGDRIDLGGIATITNAQVTSPGTVTVQTTSGTYLLTNVSFAPGANQAFFWATDGATGDQYIDVAPPSDTWTGAAGSDLGTAANWNGGVPTVSDSLFFSSNNGGLLTGAASGLIAHVSGSNGWVLQGATLILGGFPNPPYGDLALDDTGTLTVNGGTLGSPGAINIYSGAASAAAMVAEGGAQVDFQQETGLSSGGAPTSLLVTGAGTEWQANGGVYIGGSGAGTIAVENGGTMLVNGVGGVGLNNLATASGTILVSGPGALMSLGTAEAGMGLGGYGQGVLEVLNGGSFAMASVNNGIAVGKFAGGSGTILVSGNGATMSMSTATAGIGVGKAGRGLLAIEAGGTAVIDSTGYGIGVGQTVGGSGTVVVSGPGALLAMGTATTAMGIGQGGQGLFEILNGGTATIASTGYGVGLGQTPSGSGTLIVSGGGALLALGTATTGISIGGTRLGPGGGSGTVVVANGGSIEDGARLAVWSGSTLSVDAASGIDVGTSGSFVAGAVAIDTGESLIGAGLVQASVVNDGEIVASNALTLAASTGGTLEITSAVSGTGAITLAPGSTLRLDGSLGAGQAVDFAPGAPETLILGAPGGTIANAITGFDYGDRIEFAGTAGFTDATLNGTTLTVSGSGTSYELTNVATAAGATLRPIVGFDAATGDSFVEMVGNDVWQWASAVAGSATVAANWTLISGTPNGLGYPRAGDTAIVPFGTVSLSPDSHLKAARIEAGATAGAAVLAFSGDTAVNYARPTLDQESTIASQVQGQSAAGTTVLDATGLFVNQGTIAADGPAGSSFTIDIAGSAASGTFQPGYFINYGTIEAGPGNAMTLAVGATSELFNAGFLVADGGSLLVDGSPNAVVGGYGPVMGYAVIEAGGTIETNGAYPASINTTGGSASEMYLFADQTGGNTLKIDNLRQFSGIIQGFQAGDTIDLSTSLAIGTVVFDGINLIALELESSAGSILGTVRIADAGFTSGTFAATTLSPGTAVAGGFTITTGANGDSLLTTNAQTPTWNGGSGTWGTAAGWSGATVPSASTAAEIGVGSTASFTLDTGSAPVSTYGLVQADPNALLRITSDVTAAPATITEIAGTIEVTGGNTLQSTYFRQLGGGTLVLDTSGVLDITGHQNIGFTNNGTVAAVTGTIVANGTTSVLNTGTLALRLDGTVLVDGGTINAGPSQLVNGASGGDILLGLDGAGTPASVIVQAGGVVTDTYAILGSGPTDFGAITLSGPRSSWTDAGDPNDGFDHGGFMTVGFNNQVALTPTLTAALPYVAAAQLTVENGATLTEAERAYIGDNTDSAGTVTIASNGLWDVGFATGGLLAVGLRGTGALAINSGGTVEVGNTFTYLNNGATTTAGGIGIGEFAGSSGTVAVAGGGVLNDAGGASIGFLGQGTLAVGTGGTATMGGFATLGNQTGGAGTVFVAGTGADLIFTNANTGVTVGNGGQGLLEVANGGTVLIQSAGGGLGIGQGAGGSGTVIASGAGALLSTAAGDNVTVGGSGAATLVASGSGSVVVGGNLILGGSLGGIVSVDAASTIKVGSGAASPAGAVAVVSGHVVQGYGTVAAAIANDGTVATSAGFANPGQENTLEVTGSVSGTGSMVLAPNTFLRLDGPVASGQTIAFAGGGAAILVLGTTPGTIANPITGLNVGDRIDLGGIATITSAQVTSPGTVTVQTTSGTYLLTNVSFAPGANQSFYWYTDGATGDQAIQVVPAGLTWTGASSTDLGTAANWSPASVPTSVDTINFSSNNGGTLTGTGSGLAANFSGTGAWLLQSSTLSLAGQPSPPYQPYALGDSGTLTVDGGTLDAAGGSSVDSALGAAVVAEGGAQVSFEGSGIGDYASNSGSLLVTGPGTTWREVYSASPAGYGGFLNVGGASGSVGQVTITNGATIIDAVGEEIGIQQGSTGTVTVSGGGTMQDGGINIGESGAGTLTVSSGTVTTSGYSTIGANTGGTGVASVTGGGIWTNSQALTVGSAGAGTLTVAGGTVSAGTGLTIGSGGGGAGTLSIQAGGTVTDNGTYTFAGAGSGSAGTITVSGSGAVLDGPAAFIVGNSGTGVATVSNGGVVNAGAQIAVGQLNQSNGALTIESGGIVTGTGGVTIGNTAGSDGQLTILAGGTLALTGTAETSFPEFRIGLNGASSSGGTLLPAAQGNVLVQGSGALLNAGANALFIGGGTGGDGTLTVAQGGTVTAASANSFQIGAVMAGNAQGDAATVIVTDPGSRLNSEGFTLFGRGGTATLTIANGGAVVVTDSPVGGSGIEIGAGRGAGPLGPAYVGGSGNATVTTGGVLDLNSTTTGLLVGGNGASGTLAVTNGGTVLPGTVLNVGFATKAGGTIYGGTGTVTVGAGGTVDVVAPAETSSFAVVVGGDAATVGGPTDLASGTLAVTGAGALLRSASGLAVGLAGTGSLTVSQGGSVGVSTLNSGLLGAMIVAKQGNGGVTVTDAGSTLSATGDVLIGREGTGTLSVENQGSLLVGLDPTGTGDLLIGGANLANGTLYVGGSGSAHVSGGGRIAVAGAIAVGENGTDGTLTVGAGGTVTTAGSLEIGGSISLAPGAVIVSTVGTTVAAGGALVGAPGIVDVTGGGTIEAGAGLSIAAGSTLSVDATSGIDIGASGAFVAGAVAIDAGTSLSGDGIVQAAIANDGGITAGAGGRLEIAGAVSGAGDITLAPGGTLQLDGALGSGQTIVFASGAPATLVLGAPGSGITNTIQNLGDEDRIAFGGGITVTSATVVNGATIAVDIIAGGSAGIYDLTRVGFAPGASGTVSVGTDPLTGNGYVFMMPEVVASGSSLVNPIIQPGEILEVQAGGTITGGTVAAGGSEYVDSGAVVSAPTINAGGVVQVSGGGTIASAVINGGTVSIAATGTVSGGVTFGAGAGMLVLDATNGSLLPGATIAGFANTDTIQLNSIGYDPTGTVTLGAGNLLTIIENGATYTLQLDPTQNFSGQYFHLSPDGTAVTTDNNPCYLAGTLITTEQGEVPVEELAIGDRVLTLDGSFKPIKWIGTRSYTGLFAATNVRAYPVLIRAGALGDDLPRRDLYVSADHALYLHDVLIPAGSLINGASIKVAEGIEPIHYFHIELAAHDVIFAEGVAAESFVDCDSRLMFHNAAEFARLYPHEPGRAWAFCAPRLEEGLQVEQIRQEIAARAGLVVSPDAAAGPLAGFLDSATRERITGWAFHPDAPGFPVELEVLDGEALLMRFVARAFRADLRDAGYGEGCASFDVALPLPLAPGRAHEIHVRRAVDGRDLPGSPVHVPAVAAALEQARAGLRALQAGAARITPAEIDALLAEFIGEIEVLRGARAALLSGPGCDRHGRRRGAPRALVIDDVLPDVERDAGSCAILSHMRTLARLGYLVEFVASANLVATGPVAAALRAEGVVVHGLPVLTSVEEVLRRADGEFEVIYLHRLRNAEAYAARARELHPKARLIYALADLHGLRLGRRAATERWPALLGESQMVHTRELLAMRLVDVVITHSTHEASVVRQAAPGARVHVVPWEIAPAGRLPAFSRRSGVALLGHYGHAPNVDAANWLIGEIMPLVWEKDAGIPCLLAGSAMPPGMVEWAVRDPRVRVLGQVDNLRDLFGQARLTVAPLRYGAGVKGKVLDSLAAGVPCIMSPIAAEGIPLPPALARLVGQDAETIAGLVVALHTDAGMNAMAARAGRGMIRSAFSAACVKAGLAGVLSRGNTGEPASIGPSGDRQAGDLVLVR